MLGIPIKISCVPVQGEYNLVGGFALPLLTVCHRPLLWYAWPSSAQGYESNCDCDSIVSKTLECSRVSMPSHTCTYARTHPDAPQTHTSRASHTGGALITSTHLTLSYPFILPLCPSVTYHRVCH